MFCIKFDIATWKGYISTLLWLIFFINVKNIMFSTTPLSINALYIGTPLKLVVLYRGLMWLLIAIVGL
jgi:hypothetical protein